MKGVPQDKLFGTIYTMESTLNLLVDSMTQFRKANEDMDITCLFEKLHYLLYQEDIYWYDSNDEFDSFDQMYIADRNFYLHLPVQVPIKGALFKAQYKEYLKNRIVRRNAEQKQEMMDYYAHIWKHI